MSETTITDRPLYLSEEEALALLDLCVMSRTEMDSTKERAMIKLTCLVRRFISCGDEALAPEEAETHTRPMEKMEARCECRITTARRSIPIMKRLHVWRGMNPLRYV